jgi:hypothetical protein
MSFRDYVTIPFVNYVNNCEVFLVEFSILFGLDSQKLPSPEPILRDLIAFSSSKSNCILLLIFLKNYKSSTIALDLVTFS